MEITQNIKESSREYWENDSNYEFMLMRYEDRKAIGDEAIKKRKALEDIKQEDPFYHRVAVSAEMAQMRWDMAFIVEENKRLRSMIETIGWLHKRVDIIYGAYEHVKMLAERCRIDYSLIESGIKQIVKLREELTNAIKQRNNDTDGSSG